MVDYDALNRGLRRKGLDVHRVADGLGRPIDVKIKPLVTVLNAVGYKTTGSCEGHPLQERRELLVNDARHPTTVVLDETDRYIVVQDITYEAQGEQFVYTKSFDECPWVDLDLSEKQGLKLQRIVNCYNTSNSVQWRVKKGAYDESRGRNLRRLLTIPEYTLDEMQADLPRLGRHIYENTPRFGNLPRIALGKSASVGR